MITPANKKGHPNKDDPCRFAVTTPVDDDSIVAKSLAALCTTSQKILIDNQIVELPETYLMPQFSLTPVDFEQHLQQVRKELCSGLQCCRDCTHFIPVIDTHFLGSGLCGYRYRLKGTTAFGGTACIHFEKKEE